MIHRDGLFDLWERINDIRMRLYSSIIDEMKR